jgi:glutaredoxin
MKNLIIVALLVLGGYQLYNQINLGKVEPEYNHSYVVVYGRDSCGWTNRMRKSLAAQGIDFEYRQIDEKIVADNIHQRMGSAGIDTGYYFLPVVEVNGNIQARPELDWVLSNL